MAESPSNQFGGVTLKSLLENPDLLQPPVNPQDKESDKEKQLEEWGIDPSQMSSAFLGPTLWDKTLKFDGNDFNLESMDLDEFLTENGILLPEEATMESTAESLSSQESGEDTALIPALLKSNANSVVAKDTTEAMEASSDKPKQMETLASASPLREPSPVTVQVQFPLSPTDVALATAPGQEAFDPRVHNFSEDELKPQPMIKKSKKVFVPSELKDEKYWQRRNKNNVAAKRSRDARRIKENQIAIKASYLSKENDALKTEAVTMKKEILSLKKVIESYEKKVQMLTEKLEKKAAASS